ncbi:hypothetical protein RFI_15745 [Reticulomyxa filosa]|uniref:Uncharacterized protein n=1 Tax=Reticulomyxa filosa TaxID=46433 RepID=X6N6U6_RETFI|nr:hypothetical protein RFI_15745 [Reticulomyxa filosa]|eukprot:ETO21459.1 hypothetical protein RFI_15745 [Reticulomyxa filosa]
MVKVSTCLEPGQDHPQIYAHWGGTQLLVNLCVTPLQTWLCVYAVGHLCASQKIFGKLKVSFICYQISVVIYQWTSFLYYVPFRYAGLPIYYPFCYIAEFMLFFCGALTYIMANIFWLLRLLSVFQGTKWELSNSIRRVLFVILSIVFTVFPFLAFWIGFTSHCVRPLRCTDFDILHAFSIYNRHVRITVFFFYHINPDKPHNNFFFFIIVIIMIIISSNRDLWECYGWDNWAWTGLTALGGIVNFGISSVLAYLYISRLRKVHQLAQNNNDVSDGNSYERIQRSSVIAVTSIISTMIAIGITALLQTEYFFMNIDGLLNGCLALSAFNFGDSMYKFLCCGCIRAGLVLELHPNHFGIKTQ